MSDDDRAHLLTACLRGERRAQRELYDHYKGRMFALCLRYADNRQDAEDWLQEGFLKVFRDLHQYRQAGNLEGWMRRVIVNTVLENLRKQKRLSLPVEPDDMERIPDAETPDWEEEGELARRLLSLLHRLPPGFRTVLNLYVFEGYTHREIADELGIAVGTSKSQLLRARALLKEMYEKHLISS